ncbi:hypothetical protein BKA62DRAFT_690518 [Auriculariales sp. MPI-PUGE-AT-0066]|nr:hypothetical protein BKA62DRAFT_690518 [Auriculariales sp. MPI-PUGE-AT-0066]
MDSITLGQLRNAVNAQPKPKMAVYDYRYDDEDTVMNEIEEFYSYVEVPQVSENLKAFRGSFSGDWVSATLAQKKAKIEFMLESLEHRDAEIRFTNARSLLYVLQGTFAESHDQNQQLNLIFQNSRLVRDAGGVAIILEALRTASSKHDLLSSLSDADTYQFNITPAEKQEFVEEVNTELSVYFSMLYLVLEVFKFEPEFGEELMSLDPPLPVYLFNLISSLKDKSAKGYPVKKLLLVLWKTLLACFGGVKELSRVKKLNRKLLGLADPTPNSIPLKSSPLDFQTFRQETAVKFPTFSPDPTNDQPTFKLADAYAPIPVRPHYNHHTEGDILPGAGLPGNAYSQQRPHQLPPTPAPSPPPNLGKTKKTQYQTDQSRPFVFPFSSRSRPQKLVPFAIDEADRLYSKHMHISASLYQMWRTREECILDESGLQSLPPTAKSEFSDGQGFSRMAEVLSLAKGDRRFSMTTSSQAETEGVPLPDADALNEAIEDAENRMRSATKVGNSGELRRAKEERDDLLRLKRVEQLYSSVLGILPGCVLVLLKLLLATVSATTNPNPQSATSGSFPPGVAMPGPQPPPTLEEVDVMRHREITSKAVSAILLLTLKWFKASHAMKFHHLGQLLLDSNCLLIVLKMFGLQEVSIVVATRNDSPEHNFFRYCYVHFAVHGHAGRPEDAMLNAPRQVAAQVPSPGNSGAGAAAEDDDIELISVYSWRNFFSSINFLRIVQKLTKQRSHRILLLVQYKASAIMKRILKVQHPMLHLYTLKLIKMQVPFCGRKWRQSNMKVITAIYLQCRPELRDEWLSGTEVEDVGDAHAQEQALRMLIKFYNTKRYGANLANQQASGFMHRRTSSLSVPNLEGFQSAGSGELAAGMIRPVSTPNTVVDPDVFPPLRSRAPDPTIFLPYIPEDIAFEEEYEEYLSDIGPSDAGSADAYANRPHSGSAWDRLAMIGPEIADGISDSESIGSIADFADDMRAEVAADKETVDENRNSWERMSPKTMATLPKSPAGGRRSSSGTGLRPVLHFDLDDGSAIDDDEEDDDAPEMGPIQKDRPNLLRLEKADKELTKSIKASPMRSETVTSRDHDCSPPPHRSKTASGENAHIALGFVDRGQAQIT